MNEEKRMKDYFGHHFKVYVTDYFVKIEIKGEVITMTKDKFLRIQQMVLEYRLLPDKWNCSENHK